MWMTSRNKGQCFLFLCVCHTVCSFLTNVPQNHHQTLLSPQRIISKVTFQPCFDTQKCVHVRSTSWMGKTLLSSTASRSSSSDEYDVVESSQDEETLQSLFAKECDSDGFMSKDAVQRLKIIDDLLEDGDLLLEEFNDIWNSVVTTKSSTGSVEEKVNLESFLEIYQAIDNLFEDDDEEDDVESDTIVATTNDETELKNSFEEEDTKELKTVFETLCNKESKCLAKEGLKQWSEIQQLLQDGMLGEDEFDTLWEKSPKNSSNSLEIDVEGFLSFNIALDNLFEFEEEEVEEAEEVEEIEEVEEEEALEPIAQNENAKELSMVTGEDLPPGVIFANLSNGNPIISKKDLKRWVELREMLKDGDLLPAEFKKIYDQTPKAEGTTNKLDESGFIYLYEAIDNLFEEIDEEEEAAVAKAAAASAKKEFLNLLDRILDPTNTDTLPCGLECSDREIETIVSAANSLENEASNFITQKGDISLEDLAGEWELIYTSSSTVKFNQGLSGLGGSFPNGRFAGVKQKLTFTKFLSDSEYLEKIEVPGGNSFDVKITGNWELKRSVSLFTGAATTAMRVEPGMVSYGPTTMRADHWKSIGPLNLLDISYLDEDLRIMRGTTSTETLFIFKRLS